MPTEAEIRRLRMPPGWRNLGSFSEVVEGIAAFNEGRGATAGHIYFLASEGGPIKIGYSANVHSRLRALKNSSPVQLTLLALVPGSRADERAYHRRFAEHRLHGEWFGRSDALLAEIRSLAESK